MTKLSILVVEDDPLARNVLETELKGHALQSAADAAAGLAKFKGGKSQTPQNLV